MCVKVYVWVCVCVCVCEGLCVCKALKGHLAWIPNQFKITLISIIYSDDLVLGIKITQWKSSALETKGSNCILK